MVISQLRKKIRRIRRRAQRAENKAGIEPQSGEGRKLGTARAKRFRDPKRRKASRQDQPAKARRKLARQQKAQGVEPEQQ